MLSRYGVFVCMLFLFSALTACDSVETEDMLTEQEVNALLKAIDTGFRALGTDSVVNEVISGAIPDEDMPVNPEDLLSGIPVDTTYACSEGGSINLQGTITPSVSDGGELIPNYDFSFVPSRCVVTVENATFTLDSQSGMRQQGMVSLEVLEGDNALTLATTRISTGTGMVDWKLDDRSDMCDMDLSTDVTLSVTLRSDPDSATLIDDNIDVKGGTTGTLCGIEVELSADLPENPEVFFPVDTLQ